MPLRDELGSRLHAATLDVRDRDAVRQCIAALPRDFAEISVLVNNAGLSLGGGKFHEDGLDDMLTMVDTNIKGVIHVTRAILPGMVQRDRGHVFNIGSVGRRLCDAGKQRLWLDQVVPASVHARPAGRAVGAPCPRDGARAGRRGNRILRGSARGDKSALEDFKRGFRMITAEEFSDILFYAYALPPHVNANIIEIMPTDQNWNRVAIHRTT